MNPVENYLFNQLEPYQSIMFYVRSVIIKTIPEIEERYSYKIPFYYYHKKPMLYMGVLKGTNYVDVALVQGIMLEKDFPQLQDYKNRKQVRSIRVKTLEGLDELEFVEILKKAAFLLDNSKSAWNP
ncbi:MAG: hypothetical protein COA67_02130 [Lutibacter sp.]|nr:MAG: hypothetical protein COA67_02130 [Lutibacter sp.]